MKTIIITGANGNLGNAVTKKMLDAGYRVIATIRSEKDKAEMPVHPQLEVLVADLANAAESAALVQDVISRYQQVHGALMLVGGYASGSIDTASLADITKMFTLNFDTAYNVAKPLFAHMHTLGYGRLVFIGSKAAIKGVDGKGSIGYGLSKSLLFKLAEYLNAEAKNKNVVATVVVPSTLDTEINRKSMPDADPANWVKPDQLAAILEFICNDTSDPLRETVLKVYNNA